MNFFITGARKGTNRLNAPSNLRKFEGKTNTLTRKFSTFSAKILRHIIELRQDRYLSMHKLSNRAVCARADLAQSKTL